MASPAPRSTPESLTIIGASLAGLRAAEGARQAGFAGPITMVGAETHRPYDRPPLSKQLIKGDWEPERVALRKPEVLDALDLTWRLGVSAVRYDPETAMVALSDGTSVSATAMIIATGGVVRDLPAEMTASVTAAGPKVTALRTLDDALAIREILQRPDQRVVVIGAGFIGLEVAASARVRGHQVTVLEGAPAPLIRGLGASMGAAIAELHRGQGTTVHCGVTVDKITDAGVHLSDDVIVAGSIIDGVIPADLVVVGIGVRPATDWLEGSGLIIDDGIVCDAHLRVTGSVGAQHLVYAAGDVARWHHQVLDQVIRVEHWTNAAEQGALAATNLLAAAAGTEQTPYTAVPFFWSDQPPYRIQYLGRSGPEDQVTITEGSVEEGKWLAVYQRDGVITAALGINNPKAVMPYRSLIGQKA
jgi:NADPH-dependent 2,4-dienoyl-CoA reductase/sulfur reductase-like enzyme